MLRLVIISLPCKCLICRYAICGDQTIKSIAKIRPSNRARLANIDGVNQVNLDLLNSLFVYNLSSKMSHGFYLSTLMKEVNHLFLCYDHRNPGRLSN